MRNGLLKRRLNGNNEARNYGSKKETKRRYFHAMASAKKRKIRIDGVKIDNRLAEEEEKIGKVVLEYFKGFT